MWQHVSKSNKNILNIMRIIINWKLDFICFLDSNFSFECQKILTVIITFDCLSPPERDNSEQHSPRSFRCSTPIICSLEISSSATMNTFECNLLNLRTQYTFFRPALDTWPVHINLWKADTEVIEQNINLMKSHKKFSFTVNCRP